MKKFFSILMSIAMMLSITAGFNITAQAAGYSYESEDNNTYQKADTIPLGNTMFGRCSDDWDDDYYKFTLKSDSIVNIYFSCAPTSSDGYWRVSVYKYEGNNSLKQLDNRQFYCYDGSGKFSTLGLPSGTYYIEVESYRAHYQYEIMVSASATNNWETEFNNTYQTADPISIGTTKYGNNCDAWDDDYYKFVLSSQKNISISVSHKKYNTDAYIWVTLYRYNGNNSLNQIVRDRVYYCDSTYTTSSYGLSAGTYFIAIDDAYQSYGYNYGLTVNDLTKPGNTSITSLTNTAYGFKVNWSKVNDTTGYQIQYSTKSNFSGAATVYGGAKNTTTNTITGRACGTKYYVRVRTYRTLADGSRVWGNWSGPKSITTTAKPSTTSIKSVSGVSCGFKVNWTKISNTTGYQLQYSTRSDFKGGAYVYGGATNTTSTTVTGRARNTKYYVRVRTYKTLADGTRVWGNWTSAKAVYTK